jgi:hypothetical protein
MSEKKVVDRKIAVALGTACLVLLAILAGTILFFNVENTILQNQVNDLNKVVDFQKTVTWLNNKTITINPNQNVTEAFNAPLSGNVEATGFVQPPNPNYWINLSWSVLYDVGSSTGPVYTVYPTPSIRNGFPTYFDYEFPIVSFAQFVNNGEPDVALTIGNGSPNSTITVNMTVTFTY